jgi:tubulin polyglutamylase TTLL9
MQQQQQQEEEEGTILFRCSNRNLMHEVMSNRPNWEETTDDVEWDINWADVGWVRDFYDGIQMDEDQLLNHFPNHYELTRKDLMVKNLKRMKRKLHKNDCPGEAASYSFWTETFVLPSEYGLFLEEFKRHPGAMWIMKPIGRAQGKGIFLFDRLNQVG